MKLIIDIPNELAEKEHWYTDKEIWTVIKAAHNGTPIPDNATNGDVIMAMFPNAELFNEESTCVTLRFDCGKYIEYVDFYDVFWNALYQKGGNNEYGNT